MGISREECLHNFLMSEKVSLRMLSLNRITEWLNEIDLLRKAQPGIASC